MLRSCRRVSNIHFRAPTRIYRTGLAIHTSAPTLHSHSSVLEKNEEARKACEGVTKFGMWVNGFLMVTKGAAGLFANSQALIADAAHSLSDFTSDIVTLYIVQHVRKPHTQAYPYGFGRYEAIGSLSVGALLLVTAAKISYESTIGLIHQIHEKYLPNVSLLDYLPEVHSHGMDLSSPLPAALALTAAVGSIVSKEWVFRVTKNVGEKFNSQVILANAWHHRTDAFSSIVAVIGVGAAYGFDIAWADQVAGLVVGGMVGRTAYAITKESIQDLTDKQATGPIRDEISNLLMQVEGVRNFHRLRIRKMGPYYALDCHIVVDGLVSVSAAHQIAERAKYEIQANLEAVTDVVVHVDPDESETLHHSDDHKRYHDAQMSGTAHHSHDNEYLQRPQEQVQADVQAIVKKYDQVEGVTHFTCHYLNRRLFVEMEVRMREGSLRIDEASDIGKRIQAEVVAQIADIHHIDIHLEIFNNSPTEQNRNL